jgi:glycosyltransferase involved in cell wall biosynthesis
MDERMTSRSCAWLVPAPIRGSGGHRTIAQNVRALADAGWDCHLYVEDGGGSADWLSFGPLPAQFHEGWTLDRDFDLAFATAWFTAEPLRASRRARRKCYFIQDYEALFQPMGDSYVRAQNSFRYGFDSIAIGRWLPHRLKEELGVACASFDFCAEKSVYRASDDKRERSVCFLYQPDKPRRLPLLGAQALAIVKRERPEVRIQLYGSDERDSLPFEAERLGLVTVEQCAELYARSAVGLCMSSTNPSRVPFEMMACGLPVVDLHGDNNRFDLPDTAALLAEPTPESIAVALIRLLDDEPERRRRSEAGLAFMADRDLPHGYAQLVAFAEGRATPAAGAPIYRQPAVVATSAQLEKFATILDNWPPRTPPMDETLDQSILTRTRRRLEHTLRVLLTGR